MCIFVGAAADDDGDDSFTHLLTHKKFQFIRISTRDKIINWINFSPCYS